MSGIQLYLITYWLAFCLYCFYQYSFKLFPKNCYYYIILNMNHMTMRIISVMLVLKIELVIFLQVFFFLFKFAIYDKVRTSVMFMWPFQINPCSSFVRLFYEFCIPSYIKELDNLFLLFLLIWYFDIDQHLYACISFKNLFHIIWYHIAKSKI